MTFVFNNLQEYKTAKATNGKIYNALTAANKLSITSFISDININAIDSVNIITDVKNGSLGDLLIYKDGIFYWAKGKFGSTTTISSNEIQRTKLTALGYILIGWCIERKGNNCLIASVNNLGTCKWDPDASSESSDLYGTCVVPNCFTSSQIVRNDNYTTWIASGSMEVAESYYTSSTNQYVLPILRSTWDSAAKDSSLTYSGTEGSVTINKSEYNNDFNTWYKEKILVKFPTNKGVMMHFNGKESTKAIIDQFGADKTYAANLCYKYGIEDVPGFTTGNWYLPSIVELWNIQKNKLFLSSCGMPITNSWFWTSTQFSKNTAWNVLMYNGYLNTNFKYPAGYVQAVAAFKI